MAWKTCTSWSAFGKLYLLVTQVDVMLHTNKQTNKKDKRISPCTSSNRSKKEFKQEEELA